MRADWSQIGHTDLITENRIVGVPEPQIFSRRPQAVFLVATVFSLDQVHDALAAIKNDSIDGAARPRHYAVCCWVLPWKLFRFQSPTVG